MSQLNLSSNRLPTFKRPALKLVKTAPTTARVSRTSFVVAGMLVGGILLIAITNLLLQIATSTSVYELSRLQQEKRELATTVQILGEQVDSLASQQNLANAAEQLGMISNANPVFLKLEGQKVFGKPTAALDTAGRAMKNMVPNSQLVKKSAAALVAAEQLGAAVNSEPDTASNQAEITAAEVVLPLNNTTVSPIH